jgi:hypothetical protein
MKKTALLFSTATLMAGTACGVWAETDNTSSSSFDRVERGVYDSSITQKDADVKTYSPRTTTSGGNAVSDSGQDWRDEARDEMDQGVVATSDGTDDDDRTITSGGSPLADEDGRSLPRAEDK